jgi:hypothetical protein
VKQLTVRDVIRAWLMAQDALAEVGDSNLGLWPEEGQAAVHLRKRLTPAEWGDRPWGMDFRGTPEGDAMLDQVRTWLPKGYREDKPGG